MKSRGWEPGTGAERQMRRKFASLQSPAPNPQSLAPHPHKEQAMGRHWMGMPIAAVMSLTGRVTINVFFPTAEAGEAGEELGAKVLRVGSTPRENGQHRR